MANPVKLRCVQLHDVCFVPGLGEIPKILTVEKSGEGADPRVKTLERCDDNTIALTYQVNKPTPRVKRLLIPWTLVKVAEPLDDPKKPNA